MRQLRIQNGVVVAEWQGFGVDPPSPPDASWIFVDATDRPDANVGDSYDPVTDTFTPQEMPPDYGETVGPRDFMRLFTPQEWAAVRDAAKTDPEVDYWFALASVNEPIRLKHPDTLAGLQLLVSKSLITAERVGQITNNVRP